MRYTKPEIQNESKATSQIMGAKHDPIRFEATVPPKPTLLAAYEADE